MLDRETKTSLAGALAVVVGVALLIGIAMAIAPKTAYLGAVPMAADRAMIFDTSTGEAWIIEWNGDAWKREKVR